MPSAPAQARSPRSSGGSSAATVSQLLRDAVDGNTPPTGAHRHHLPLQTFSGVHGEHLDPVPGDRQLGGRQTVLHHLGRVQVGQQAGDRRCRRSGCAFGVAGDRIGERVEVLGSRPARGGRHRGPDFAVDAQHAPHLGDQIGQGMTEMGSAARAIRRPARRCADIPQPNTCRPGRGSPIDSARHALSVSGPAAMAIDSGVGVSPGCSRPVRRARHSAAISRAPSRHRGPVSTRIAAAPAVGSATSRSMATTSATSVTEQAGQADDLDGNSAGAQGIRNGCCVGVATDQYRGGSAG